MIILLSISAVSLLIGLTDTPDSFQYFALGKYLYFKELLPQAPFNYDRPRTLFGPLYALFVTPLYQLPVPMGSLLIPFIQLTLVAISAVLIYKAMQQIFHKPWPLITAIIFLLLPYNLIYATFMMSETLTQFFCCMLPFYHVAVSKKCAQSHILAPHPVWSSGNAHAFRISDTFCGFFHRMDEHIHEEPHRRKNTSLASCMLWSRDRHTVVTIQLSDKRCMDLVHILRTPLIRQRRYGWNIVTRHE